MSKPILWIVIPCYNEEQVLPITAPLFLKKINDLSAAGLVSEKSRVLFVNDGSRDATWSLIQKFASEDEHFIGISQSRNRGHQNAVLAGLMEALHSGSCDITISIDCDGQDDINAMDEMVKKYLDGAEVVYGVRSRRDTDTFFKRFTAEGFYHVMNALGADIVFNHADYRLISTRVLESFADYKEVNIFLRGMVPLVGPRQHGVLVAAVAALGNADIVLILRGKALDQFPCFVAGAIVDKEHPAFIADQPLCGQTVDLFQKHGCCNGQHLLLVVAGDHDPEYGLGHCFIAPY